MSSSTTGLRAAATAAAGLAARRASRRSFLSLRRPRAARRGAATSSSSERTRVRSPPPPSPPTTAHSSETRRRARRPTRPARMRGRRTLAGTDIDNDESYRKRLPPGSARGWFSPGVPANPAPREGRSPSLAAAGRAIAARDFGTLRRRRRGGGRRRGTPRAHGGSGVRGPSRYAGLRLNNLHFVAISWRSTRLALPPPPNRARCCARASRARRACSAPAWARARRAHRPPPPPRAPLAQALAQVVDEDGARVLARRLEGVLAPPAQQHELGSRASSR